MINKKIISQEESADIGRQVFNEGELAIPLRSLSQAQLKGLFDLGFFDDVEVIAFPAPSPAVLVEKFHETYKLPIRTVPELNVPEKMLRLDLVEEETKEYREAVKTDDLVEIADALADLVYVCYGAALTHGINLDEVLEEVQKSNMSKLDADGNPIYREDGKVLKGLNFFTPEIETVLKKHGWVSTQNEETE